MEMKSRPRRQPISSAKDPLKRPNLHRVRAFEKQIHSGVFVYYFESLDGTELTRASSGASPIVRLATDNHSTVTLSGVLYAFPQLSQA
jgi:hypothetical protein